jgi:hypothetical protein
LCGMNSSGESSFCAVVDVHESTTIKAKSKDLFIISFDFKECLSNTESICVAKKKNFPNF